MIRFGPAGIPLSCKGRTLMDGVVDVHNLSLTALEIQMIRSETIELYPDEDLVGLTMKEVEDVLPVEILRGDETFIDPDEPIEEDDIIICMESGVTDSFSELFDIRDQARRLDVELSLHTPHYMDLSSNNDLTNSCIDCIRYSGVVANAVGADVVTTNLGLYSPSMDLDEADQNIYENVAYIMDWWHDNGLKPKLGIEITGKENVFGSLEQVTDICDQIEGLVPVVNWPGCYMRNGHMESWEVEDFDYILDTVEPYSNGKIHSIFSGLEQHNWTDSRLSPIKKGNFRFETLAECLVERKPDITIISSSPLLEHDAMYMRTIHERYLVKKVAKALKNKKKEEKKEEAQAASDETA